MRLWIANDTKVLAAERTSLWVKLALLVGITSSAGSITTDRCVTGYLACVALLCFRKWVACFALTKLSNTKRHWIYTITHFTADGLRTSIRHVIAHPRVFWTC